VIRRASLFNTDRVYYLYHDPHLGGAALTLHYGDLSDGTSLRRAFETVDPDEVYNLGTQSHVKISFDLPEYTADVVAMGTLRLIEACATISCIAAARCATTRPAHRKCLVLRRRHKVKGLHFTRGVPMVSARYRRTGLQSIIVRPMIFLYAMVFYLIMKVLVAGRPSLRAR
jgi:hypothetical protein